MLEWKEMKLGKDQVARVTWDSARTCWDYKNDFSDSNFSKENLCLHTLVEKISHILHTMVRKQQNAHCSFFFGLLGPTGSLDTFCKPN